MPGMPSKESLSGGEVQPASSSGPRLVLKIRSDGGGGLAASTAVPELEVDPIEEAELNRWHERLHEIAQQHGLNSVQPEAIAVLARAVKAQAHRVLAAAIIDVKKDAPPPPALHPKLSTANLSKAIRQSAAAPNPPAQQAGPRAWNRFVS